MGEVTERRQRETRKKTEERHGEEWSMRERE